MLVHDQPGTKITNTNGEKRSYYVMPFIPSWAAVQTYLGFFEGIDVKPPRFWGRPNYPGMLEEGKGVAIVDAPLIKVFPTFLLDAAVILGIIIVSFLTNSPAPLLLLLIALPVLAALTWLAYVSWLTTAMVVKENSVTFFKGFFVTRHKSVQGADLNGVEVGPIGKTLFAQVIAKWLDLSYVEAELATNVNEKKKRKTFDRFMLRGIRNGEAVSKLINDLQSKWERSIAESAKSEEESANYLASIDGKLDPQLLEEFGRVFVAASNREARLLRELIDQNKEIIPLLRMVAKGVGVSENTSPIPVIPQMPAEPPRSRPPANLDEDPPQE